MKNLSTVLRESYDGQWSKFPCPTETLEDYDLIVWATESPPSKEELSGLGVFPTPKEQKAAEPIRVLRENRNRLLADSDWTGLADSALTSEIAAQWKLYRQKLRDLPGGLDTEFKVKNVKWPDSP